MSSPGRRRVGADLDVRVAASGAPSTRITTAAERAEILAVRLRFIAGFYGPRVRAIRARSFSKPVRGFGNESQVCGRSSGSPFESIDVHRLGRSEWRISDAADPDHILGSSSARRHDRFEIVLMSDPVRWAMRSRSSPLSSRSGTAAASAVSFSPSGQRRRTVRPGRTPRGCDALRTSRAAVRRGSTRVASPASSDGFVSFLAPASAPVRGEPSRLLTSRSQCYYVPVVSNTE